MGAVSLDLQSINLPISSVPSQQNQPRNTTPIENKQVIRHNVKKMNQALENHRTAQSRKIEYDKINNAIQSNDELVVFNNGLYS